MLMCGYMKHGIGERCLDLELAFLRDIEITDGQSRATGYFARSITI